MTSSPALRHHRPNWRSWPRRGVLISGLLWLATAAAADGIEWTDLPASQQFDGQIISLGYPEDSINVAFIDFLLDHLGGVVALDVELAFLYGWGDLSVYCEPPVGVEENNTELRLYYVEPDHLVDSAGNAADGAADSGDIEGTPGETEDEPTRKEMTEEHCGPANFFHVTIPTDAFYATGVDMAVQLYRIKGEFVVTTSDKWKRYIDLERWPKR